MIQTTGGKETLISILAKDQMDVFHSQGDQGNDNLEDENVYIDLGDDPDSDLHETLNNLVMEAQGNGLNEAGVERLRELLQKYGKIFRLRLGASEQAQVAPRNIQLQEGLKPVRVKARRYSTDERDWLEKYVDKLVKMNFIVPNSHAAWQAAPMPVPKKNLKAKYRLAIDFALLIPQLSNWHGPCVTWALKYTILRTVNVSQQLNFVRDTGSCRWTKVLGTHAELSRRNVRTLQQECSLG